MKKLSMLFVVAALALGGCKKSVDKEKVDDKAVAKPVDEVKPATPEKPGDQAKPADTKPGDETKPADTKPADTKPAETVTLLPECQAYQDAIKKLESCDKIGADTKKTFDEAFAQASKAWANLPAESKDTVAKACKSAADSVTAAAAACK